MAIKPADAFKLWGRAGGRCSVCKIPLTPVGIDGVIGEMAHIVARSLQGPRGEDPLPQDERDLYKNLILLCPNHHTEADRDTAAWTIARLHTTKDAHETWVQDQIDRGLLKTPAIGNDVLLSARLQRWASLQSHTWSIASLAPLKLDDDVVDPLSSAARQFLKAIQMPDYLSFELGTLPNPYHIEPTIDGVAIEEFRSLDKGIGYNIELHRTGYSECVVCLNALVERTSTADLRLTPAVHRLTKCELLIPYFQLVDVLYFQVKLLCSLRSELQLPFRDMVLTLGLITPAGLCLVVVGHGHYNVVGRPVAAGSVVSGVVAESPSDADSLMLASVGRLLNGFGFVLQQLRDDDGRFAMPVRLSSL